MNQSTENSRDEGAAVLLGHVSVEMRLTAEMMSPLKLGKRANCFGKPEISFAMPQFNTNSSYPNIVLPNK